MSFKYTDKDYKKITGALFIDLCKAFNYVSDFCLLGKLPYYDITGIEQQWIADYLFNRQQFVSSGDTQSDPQRILSRVPQGSTLGLLLFLILINDAYSSLENCTMLIFADDSGVFAFQSPIKRG